MGIIKRSVKGLGQGNTEAVVAIELPNCCPRCKASISPPVIFAETFDTTFKNGDRLNGDIVYACPACFRAFSGIISLNREDNTWHVSDLAPNFPQSTNFDDNIKDVSPNFVEIYHQSEAAEAYGLTQISGIGYRKSLEFLIKDYAIHTNPAENDKILEAPLGKCIEKYIQHSRIKNTAKAAVYIGNDETHYVRKWEDKDITDMKRFINSCYHFIVADITADEATEMVNS